MNADGTSWWLYLPPCPRCGQSHVLLDCTQRLPMETTEADQRRSGVARG